MPSEGGNKPGPTIDNPAHASHVPEWKKNDRRRCAHERIAYTSGKAGTVYLSGCTICGIPTGEPRHA